MSRDRLRIDIPVLYIGYPDTRTARPDSINAAKAAGLFLHLEEVMVESGHRYVFEKTVEVTMAIRGSLENRC